LSDSQESILKIFNYASFQVPTAIWHKCRPTCFKFSDKNISYVNESKQNYSNKNSFDLSEENLTRLHEIVKKTYPVFHAFSLVWTKAHWRRSEASTARRRSAAAGTAPETGHNPEPSSAAADDAVGGESPDRGTPSCCRGGGDDVDGDCDAGTGHLSVAASVSGVSRCCEWNWWRTTLNICSSGGGQVGVGRFAAGNQPIW